MISINDGTFIFLNNIFFGNFLLYESRNLFLIGGTKPGQVGKIAAEWIFFSWIGFSRFERAAVFDSDYSSLHRVVTVSEDLITIDESFQGNDFLLAPSPSAHWQPMRAQVIADTWTMNVIDNLLIMFAMLHSPIPSRSWRVKLGHHWRTPVNGCMAAMFSFNLIWDWSWMRWHWH